VPSGRRTSRLFNASGRARELRASPLFAIGSSVGIAAGYCFAVSLRLAIVGLTMGLATLIAALAWRLWPDPVGGERGEAAPDLPPPMPAAR
jgi:hypothetical protein